MPTQPKKLRSTMWMDDDGVHGFLRRAGFKAQGFTEKDFLGRPIIGICNSWSELTHCNVNLRQIAEAVKRGVWQAGGFPLEFPVMSLGEFYMMPTTMMYRNLMSMDVEESIRANPLDGVVLLSGCDKTTPAMLMGAASADIPSMFVTGGPQLKGNWKGETLGSCTDCRRYHVELRAGRISKDEYRDMEANIYRSAGHCMVMGTASTMGCILEALGMTLPGGGVIPAVDSRRYALAEETGRRIVDLVKKDLKPSTIIDVQSLENAIRVLMAVGGSTNAVVHLVAIAGRLGIKLPLSLFDEISKNTPVLANVKPSGEYLMEDLFYAGGISALMRELGSLLHLDKITVSGRTLGEEISSAETFDSKVIQSVKSPLNREGGLVVLSGNLAPNGAILKQTSASQHLFRHKGRAVVFENYSDMENRVDDPSLDVTEDDVLVLRNIGPKGGPGFPEWGFMPIPQKLLKKGIRDMVRINDGRMSGTAYGTIALHISPEAAVGGPLAVVENGDPIFIDVDARKLELHIPQNDLEKRLAKFKPTYPMYKRGYRRLFLEHILQAEDGCDFDFLKA